MNEGAAAIVNLDTLLEEASEAPPCGPNLEHDLAFFELEDAGRAKPEQRVGDAVRPGEDPRWPKVVELGTAILARSKDLRVAVLLTRALTHTESILGLAAGLGLVHGLLERYWDQVHPVLEVDADNDPTERLNALAPLADSETLIKDLRETELVSSREHGQLRVRDVEIALRRLVPVAGAAVASKPLHEVHAQIAAAFAEDRAVPNALREAGERVAAIQSLLTDRVGGDRAVDLKPLAQSIDSLREACDAALGTRTAAADAAGGETVGGVGPAVIDGEFRNRDEAVRALDLVCRWLERHEPTNPAPLFIRRAQRLMTKSFVEIVKDLLPDSLSNLERLTGEPENK